MMSALSGVVSCWAQILTSPNVPFSKIQSIERENASELMRLAASFHTWVVTRRSLATWQKLINTLNDYDLKETILKVEQRMRAKYKEYITQK